jgi:hypothetical protein
MTANPATFGSWWHDNESAPLVSQPEWERRPHSWSRKSFFISHSVAENSPSDIAEWFATLPKTFDEVHDAIVTRRDPLTVVGSLTDDWDGAGALAPTEDIVGTVRRVLHLFENIVPDPEVTANENGTVTIEWDHGANFASVEIGATSFAFIMRTTSGRTRFLGGDAARLDATTALEIESGLYPELSSPSLTVGTYTPLTVGTLATR